MKEGNIKKKEGWPELGGLGLVLVEKGLLNIIGGIKLGRLHGGSVGLRLGVVAGESAAVFGLDGPQASLVVHLRPRILSNASYQFWVSCNPNGLSLLASHFLFPLYSLLLPSFCSATTQWKERSSVERVSIYTPLALGFCSYHKWIWAFWPGPLFTFTTQSNRSIM